MEFFVRRQTLLSPGDNDLVFREYQSYLVPGSKVMLICFPGGRMLSQELEGSDFQIWFHDFFIEEPVTIFSTTKQSLRVLHYALTGNLSPAPARAEALTLAEGKYYLLNVPAEEEQLLFIKPGVSQVFQVDFFAPFSDKIPGNVVSEEQLPYGLDRMSPIVSCGLNDYRVKTVIKTIRENQVTNATEQDFFLGGRIMDLLQLQAHHLAIKSRSSEYAPHQKMEAIQDYILTHLEQPLSITTVCQQFHITKGVLQKYFKQYAKQPFHAYIRKQRMEYGAFLLQGGEKQVSEIALLTGYKDISGFRRAFKAYFGFSPSQMASNKIDPNSPKII